MEPNRYFDVYTKVTQSPHSVENALVAYRRQEVLRSVRQYRHDIVLEIGCGLDPLFSHYDDFSKHIIVEPVAEFAARATELAGGRADIAIVQGFLQTSIGELDVHAYDVIIASGLLHEVPSAVEFVDALVKLAGPSTVVHINVPNMRSFHRLLAQEMGLISHTQEPSELDRQLGHTGWFDKDGIFALVQSAGLEVLEFGTYFVKPFANAQLETMLAQGIVSPQIFDGLARMSQYMPDLGAEMFVNCRRAVQVR